MMKKLLKAECFRIVCESQILDDLVDYTDCISQRLVTRANGDFFETRVAADRLGPRNHGFNLRLLIIN